MAIRIVNGQVVGSREYSFTGNDGREVNMVQVFVEYPDNRVSGIACCALNMSFRAYSNDGLKIGETIRITFADKRWQYVGSD